MMGSQYIGSEKKFVKCQVSKFPIYLGQIVQGLNYRPLQTLVKASYLEFRIHHFSFDEFFFYLIYIAHIRQS